MIFLFEHRPTCTKHCTCMTCMYAIIFMTGVQGALIITPQNAVAMSGEVAVLSCASDSDNVTWVAYSPGPSEREYIFSGGTLSQSVSSYISISQEKRGHCSLRINATMLAAKRYVCVEQGSATTASAELIVLGNSSSLIDFIL